MTDDSGLGGNPFGEIDPESLRDAPLFRELQRVISASTGPVNWELARQVGVASAAEAPGDDRAPTDTDLRMLEEAVRVAELHVARFTGLEPPTDVAHVRPIRRAEWVTLNADGLRSLVEPAAGRMVQAMERAMRAQAPQELGPIAGLLSQIGPLIQGTQVGTVLGELARHALGLYDVAVPRSDAPELVFVVPNLRAFEQDWSLDAPELRTYVAVHEVTHRFELSRPWTRAHFGTLIDDYLSTLQIDVEAIQQRLATLDASDPEALRSAMDSGEGLFGPVMDDEQWLKLARIQAFMAAAEGYGDHVTRALGAELLASHARIEEAMRRHREREQVDAVFERLLGVEMPRERYESGSAFCDTVVELTDEATLSRMWEAPEAMPSRPEIDEPRLWLARTV